MTALWSALCRMLLGGRAPRAASAPLALVLAAVVVAGCDSVEERAENHYRSGLELLEQGSPQKARIEFRNAVRLNDSHAGAHYQLGRLFERENRYAPAIAQYQRTVALAPRNLEARVRLGELLLGFGQLEPAAKAAEAAAAIAPDDLGVLALETALHVRQREFAAARQRAERALELYPEAGDSWMLLAAVTKQEGDPETALQQIEEGIRLEPGSIKAQLAKINLLSELGRERELGAALAALAEIGPDEVAFWDALARWRLRNVTMEEARPALRRAFALAGADTARRLDLVGYVNATQGPEAAEAELLWLIGERAEAGDADALRLAHVEFLLQTDRLDAAETGLRALIEGGAEEGVLLDARPLLARIRLARDDVEGARAIVDEALAEDPRNAGALTLRGRLMILDEDYDGAIRELRAAEAEEPGNVETVRLQALAHQRAGSRDLARERLATAVELSGGAEHDVLSYARFLVAEGDADLAHDLLGDMLARGSASRRIVEALAAVKITLGRFEELERLGRQIAGNEEAAELSERLVAAGLAGQERYDETLAILEANRAEGDPDGGYLAAIVQTHLRNDDLPAAERAVAEAAAENPDDPATLRLEGALALLRDERAEAGRLFGKAAARGPEVAMTHLTLARFHMLEGDREAARTALERGIEATGGDAGLRLNLAMLHEAEGRTDAAIAEYETLYVADRGNDVIANNLASLIADSDPTPEEIDRAFRIARRLRDSEVPHFVDTYGWLLYLRGDAEGAVRHLDRAAAALPDNALVRYHHGMALAAVGRSFEARRELGAAVELWEASPAPQLEAARAELARLGATAGAADGTAGTGTGADKDPAAGDAGAAPGPATGAE